MGIIKPERAMTETLYCPRYERDLHRAVCDWHQEENDPKCKECLEGEKVRK